ncbi:hypothetical protein Pelo_17119 [Pelomyxa schiedti]|nr:hypothetical protein Pelo_17119 [Pelomyxa schiedti]
MFHFSLDEVLSNDMHLNIFSTRFFDLPTWQMMLRVFPEITVSTIKEKLMCIVCQSPVIAQYTMRVFSEMTIADIAKAHMSTPRESVMFWLSDVPQCTDDHDDDEAALSSSVDIPELFD